MTNQQLCFIGGGNMATSLIGGMLANGYAPASICACDIDPAKLAELADRLGIRTSVDNRVAVESADIVILAVKPQVMQSVCENLAQATIKSDCLFVSIAAGVRESAIDRWLGGNRQIVRCMPNTPALVQLGATALFANSRVNTEQKNTAQAILNAVGITVWVNQESDLDAVTAISGSGPAYFFYFIELLQASGVALGLSPDTARRLAAQTALGAATMAQSEDVVKLRSQVTSKGGTTEQAILSFQRNGLAELVTRATEAARDRSVEMAHQSD